MGRMARKNLESQRRSGRCLIRPCFALYHSCENCFSSSDNSTAANNDDDEEDDTPQYTLESRRVRVSYCFHLPYLFDLNA